MGMHKCCVVDVCPNTVTKIIRGKVSVMGRPGHPPYSCRGQTELSLKFPRAHISSSNHGFRIIVLLSKRKRGTRFFNKNLKVFCCTARFFFTLSVAGRL